MRRDSNTNAKVKVIWTGSWRDDEKKIECARKLIDSHKADVLTYHLDKATVGEVAREFGVDFIAYNWQFENPTEYDLTSVVCQWDVYYKKILQLYLKDELRADRIFWLGIKDGIVELSDYSESVTEAQRQKLDALKQELLDDRQILVGPIYDVAGNLKCNPGEAVSENTLLGNVNYLVRGVEIVE